MSEMAHFSTDFGDTADASELDSHLEDLRETLVPAFEQAIPKVEASIFDRRSFELFFEEALATSQKQLASIKVAIAKRLVAYSRNASFLTRSQEFVKRLTGDAPQQLAEAKEELAELHDVLHLIASKRTERQEEYLTAMPQRAVYWRVPPSILGKREAIRGLLHEQMRHSAAPEAHLGDVVSRIREAEELLGLAPQSWRSEGVGRPRKIPKGLDQLLADIHELIGKAVEIQSDLVEDLTAIVERSSDQLDPNRRLQAFWLSNLEADARLQQLWAEHGNGLMDEMLTSQRLESLPIDTAEEDS